jgi:hypothetical protein
MILLLIFLHSGVEQVLELISSNVNDLYFLVAARNLTVKG